MTADEIFKASNDKLLKLLSEDQSNLLFKNTELEPDFLGFVDIYDHLSMIIPLHHTVIDFGCSYGQQSLFFQKHHRYIGIDTQTVMTVDTPNSSYYESTIRDFIVNTWSSIDDGSPVFAICSYVEDGAATKLVLETFDNVFTFYPSGKKISIGDDYAV